MHLHLIICKLSWSRSGGFHLTFGVSMHYQSPRCEFTSIRQLARANCHFLFCVFGRSAMHKCAWGAFAGWMLGEIGCECGSIQQTYLCPELFYFRHRRTYIVAGVTYEYIFNHALLNAKNFSTVSRGVFHTSFKFQLVFLSVEDCDLFLMRNLEFNIPPHKYFVYIC